VVVYKLYCTKKWINVLTPAVLDDNFLRLATEMRLVALFTILLGVVGCLAQMSTISLPKPETKVAPGQQITVQVTRPVRVKLCF